MANESYIVKDITDKRGRSDIGSAIFIKRGGDTKYHLWLPVTNIPATGSAPDTIDTTVTTARENTGISGRIQQGAREFTYLAHRDNFMILAQDNRKKRDFLLVNSDGTGWKFQGEVTTYQDETTVGSVQTAKGVVMVSHADELPIMNVADIIEETVTFTSDIDSIITLETAGTESVTIETDPVDATTTAVSDTTGVATATITSGVLTITGVAVGSAIITITAKKSDCADGVTHILVIVK